MLNLDGTLEALFFNCLVSSFAYSVDRKLLASEKGLEFFEVARVMDADSFRSLDVLVEYFRLPAAFLWSNATYGGRESALTLERRADLVLQRREPLLLELLALRRQDVVAVAVAARLDPEVVLELRALLLVELGLGDREDTALLRGNERLGRLGLWRVEVCQAPTRLVSDRCGAARKGGRS